MQRDQYNRIVLEAELKGKPNDNWKWFWLNQNLMSNVKYTGGKITFEECFHRQTGDTRDCSTVFDPGDIYYKK
ncbi:MAG: hypothetical protein ABGX14_02970 [bacterium]